MVSNKKLKVPEPKHENLISNLCLHWLVDKGDKKITMLAVSNSL